MTWRVVFWGIVIGILAAIAWNHLSRWATRREGSGVRRFLGIEPFHMDRYDTPEGGGAPMGATEKGGGGCGCS